MLIVSVRQTASIVVVGVCVYIRQSVVVIHGLVRDVRIALAHAILIRMCVVHVNLRGGAVVRQIG